MASVHIVTDGTVALPPGAAEDHGITIVPQNVVIGGQTFRAGVDLDLEELFDRMARDPGPIKTSQASPGAFRAVYEEVLGMGVEIVSMHLPKSLSGTADSARAAAAMLPENAPVTVLETDWVSVPLGFLVLRAAAAGQDGATRAEIVALVEALSPRLNLLFVVDDLSYLVRGGRLGRASGLLGTMLQVKPILELKDRQVRLVERVRTTNRAVVRLAELVQERMPPESGPAHIGLLSGRADAEVAALATFLEARYQPDELFIAPCDPTVAAHTGPGVFGAAFYAD